jgi:hypothetical protein
MRIYYARDVDVLMLELGSEKGAKSRDLGPRTTGAFDGKGRLVSLEIVGASRLYPRAELEQFGDLAPEWLTLAEAEAVARDEGATVKANTWRVLVNSDRIPSEDKRKEAGSWRISSVGVANYLESRAASGRPSPKGKPAKRAKKASRLTKR